MLSPASTILPWSIPVNVPTLCIPAPRSLCIGLVVGVLTTIRLIVHWTGPTIDKLDMPGWEQVLFRINHLLLYVAMIASLSPDF